MRKDNKTAETKRRQKMEGTKEKKTRWLHVLIALLLSAGAVSGSLFLYKQWNKAKDLAEEYTFEYNEVAKIGDEKITMEEFMLYSVDTTNSYESTYGEDIWSESTINENGEQETYENIVKKDIFEQIRMVKAFCKEADTLGISISEDELKMVNNNADSYYEDLAKAGATENEDLTKQVVRSFYRESYLAQRVYAYYMEMYPTEEDSKQEYSDEFLKKVAEVTEKHYPDFNYDYDINWELMDYLNFNVSGETDGNAEESGELE